LFQSGLRAPTVPMFNAAPSNDVSDATHVRKPGSS
jgi:hypothetical protein